MHILIVDDSTVMRRLIERNLRLAGLRVTAVHHAADGRQALTHLRRRPLVDLILTDMNMPVMNGFEFLERRQAESLALRTPTVIVAAEALGPLLRRAISLGAHACLTKPFTPAQLRRTLLPLLAHNPAPGLLRAPAAAAPMSATHF